MLTNQLIHIENIFTCNVTCKIQKKVLRENIKATFVLIFSQVMEISLNLFEMTIMTDIVVISSRKVERNGITSIMESFLWVV